MNPLLLVAAKILPGVLDLIVGDRSDEASRALAKAVSTVTGSDDPAKAQQKIEDDPAMAAELRVKLAGILAEEKKVALDADNQRRRDEQAAEAQTRRDQMDREIAAYKANLDEIAATQKASQEQRQQDLRETDGSRKMLSELLDKDAFIARTPMVLSYIVTVGFFVMLGLFVFMKGSLETPKPATLPSEIVAIVEKLKPDQLAALVQPRSDFVTQIINICVGALAAAFATVMSFWLGSSQSARNKDKLAVGIQERAAESQERQAKDTTALVAQVTSNAARVGPRPVVVVEEGGGSPGRPAVEPGPEPVLPTDPAPEPVKPAPAGLLAEIMPELTRAHRHFPASVTWALTATGIAIDGARAQGTAGEPSTIRRIWRDFGTPCAASAKKYGVPVELIVATIAAESSGDPRARRPEPQIGDESVGLMQTLVKTARGATGRANLTGNDLLDPVVSIDAGTAYIASQRGSTHFDPPRVAAAYNAGSLKRDDADANRWKLHCFPRGTGAHVDRFVGWFNDAMRVSDAEDWGKVSSCPSFADAFVGVEPDALALDTSSPEFPPRPAFRPILSLEERQRLFGTFRFVHAPVQGNPENIRILGDWESNNIVTVKIPLATFRDKPGPLTMRFHKSAKDQLVELWLAWEKAGLLDKILTFDGSYVPRFQRKSVTRLSNHAFGSAFDINAAWNPLGAEPAGIGEKGCIRELVPLANAHRFYWGGHFTTREDGMHFEVAKLM